MSHSLAVVGATGLVGRTMLRVLEERSFPHSALRLFASSRSAGTTLMFRGKRYRVEELREDSFDGIDIALFSAGGNASKRFAPIAAAAGAVVIDNSSAWRMDRKVPLVVPEVNPESVAKHHGIIANPNCSTIQLVVALAPLHEEFGLKRVVVSTYQAISGAGQSAVDQLRAESRGRRVENPKFPVQVAWNTLFHSFAQGDDYSEEETKMIRETRKIMSLPKLPITATCVRIPTIAAHGESVNVEFERPVNLRVVRRILERAPGIALLDKPHLNIYPTVLQAGNHDEVFVGRIRRDASNPHTLNLWIVADNVRKGAATNAVQIGEIVVGGW